MSQEQEVEAREAAYRYGIVFLLALAVVMFIIVTSDADWSRAIAFALVAAALLVAVETSRQPPEVRERRRIVGWGAMILITLAIGVGLLARDVSFLLIAFATVWTPVALGRGLLRLVAERGATPQAVAGGLAIYLLIGLTFASLIAFVATVGSGHFYAQGTNGSASNDVYYSFTTMTTTGFGDLTAAHRAGKALAVLEMLVGQLYLVTVIGVLIGRRVGASQSP